MIICRVVARCWDCSNLGFGDGVEKDNLWKSIELKNSSKQRERKTLAKYL